MPTLLSAPPMGMMEPRGAAVGGEGMEPGERRGVARRAAPRRCRARRPPVADVPAAARHDVRGRPSSPSTTRSAWRRARCGRRPGGGVARGGGERRQGGGERDATAEHLGEQVGQRGRGREAHPEQLALASKWGRQPPPSDETVRRAGRQLGARKRADGLRGATSSPTASPGGNAVRSIVTPRRVISNGLVQKRASAVDVRRVERARRDLGRVQDPADHRQPAARRRPGGGGARPPCPSSARRRGSRPRGARPRRPSAGTSGGRCRASSPKPMMARRRRCRRGRRRSASSAAGGSRRSTRTPTGPPRAARGRLRSSPPVVRVVSSVPSRPTTVVTPAVV